MAQWVKVPAANPDKMSYPKGPHDEGENQFLKVVH